MGPTGVIHSRAPRDSLVGSSSVTGPTGSLPPKPRRARGTERGRAELGVPSAPLVQRGEGRQVSQSDSDRAVAAMQMGSDAEGPVQ